MKDWINTVHLGDCLEVMKGIPDKSIDMILCDLPYGVTARNEWDIIIPFNHLWNQYKRIIKDNGAIALFGSQPFTSMLIMNNLEMFKYTYIWKKTIKTNFLNAKKQPLRQKEDICIFYRKQPTYNPQGVIFDSKITKQGLQCTSNYNIGNRERNYIQDTSNYPNDILEYPSISSKQHPTQKPVALFEYLIKTYTNENDVILDNCAGSGTTAIACIRTNRNYICIEKEPKYYDIIIQRIEKEKEQTKLEL